MTIVSEILLSSTFLLGLMAHAPSACGEFSVTAEKEVVCASVSDEDSLTGTWRVVYSEDSGRAAPAESLRPIRFVFTKDQLIMEMNGSKQSSTYKLGTSTNPKTMIVTQEGHTSLAIYDLQDDMLRICMSQKNGEQPTAFDSQSDSSNILLILERISPVQLDKRAGGEQKKETLDDSNAILGKWNVVFSKDSGKTAQPEMLRNVRFEFTKDNAITEIGRQKQNWDYTLDKSTDPKSIDLKVNGHTVTGIYDLQGDTLRICMPENQKGRPTAFESRPESVNDILVVLTRAKRESPSTKQRSDADSTDTKPKTDSVNK